MSELINRSVEIRLDSQGRPSTDPSDVVKLGQSLLLKAILEKTDNGTSLPGDMGELSSLIRDANNTALLTRKIDVDAGKEDLSARGAELAIAYQEMKANRGPIRPVELSDDIPNPMDAITPPPATLGEGEGLQGMQVQIPEEFIDMT